MPSSASIDIIGMPFSNPIGVANAFAFLGCDVQIAFSPSEVRRESKLVLPGVGKFGPSAQHLISSGFQELISDHVSNGQSMLGICLGYQLLFEFSDEDPFARGLGLIDGTVTNLNVFRPKTSALSRAKPTPQIGWKRVMAEYEREANVEETMEATFMYFCNSYVGVPARKPDTATTFDFYGHNLVATMRISNIWGAQCHPEKSLAAGLAFLQLFARS